MENYDSYNRREKAFASYALDLFFRNNLKKIIDVLIRAI